MLAFSRMLISVSPISVSVSNINSPVFESAMGEARVLDLTRSEKLGSSSSS